MKDVCIQFDDRACSSAGALSYIALPQCSLTVPGTTWIRYLLESSCVSFLVVKRHMHEDPGFHVNQFRHGSHT
jgi:hypothetical protein